MHKTQTKQYTWAGLVLKRFSRNALFILLAFLSGPVWSEEAETLVSASSNNFPPINLLDKEGELTGFARDLSTAVARAAGFRVQYIHSQNWPDVLEWLDSGRADFIHDTGVTEARRSRLDFTDPILEMQERIFVQQDRIDIHDFESLKGKKVACVNRHITHLYLRNFPDIQCYIVNTPAEGLVALVNGNVDAFVYPYEIALYLAKDLKLAGRIKYVGDSLRTLSWSMSVRKGNERMLERLNEGIAKVKASGEYEDIFNHWFGVRILAGYTRTEAWIIAAGTALMSITATLLGLFVVYNKRLLAAKKVVLASEHRYRTLVDHLPQCVALKTLDYRYISCNRGFSELVGRPVESVIGMQDEALFPGHYQMFRERDQDALRRKGVIRFDSSIDLNGQDILFNITKVPVYNSDGDAEGILTLLSDVTEAKTMQDALHRTTEDFAVFAESIPDILYKIDTEGRLIWWNRALQTVTGRSHKQLYGLPFISIIDQKDRSKTQAAIYHALMDGNVAIDTGVVTVDGARIFHCKATVIFDSQGEAVGLVGVGRDISERLHKERESRSLQRQLQQAQKMEAIGHLTGGVAHDFNNMLASILGYGELIQHSVDRSQQEKIGVYADEVVKAAERARDLVMQMLVFSRQQPETDNGPIRLADQVGDVIKMLRPILPSSLVIEQDLADVGLIGINEVQLQQVVMNLCVNARDALEGKGRLEISLQPARELKRSCDACHYPVHGRFVVLKVKDNGPGMDEMVRTHLFDPFFSTKDVGKGTGMGLSMVHGIVHGVGGHIVVRSAPGHGAEFDILLPPFEVTSGEQNEPDHAIIDEVDGNGARVLVVDDEQAVASFLAEYLKALGFNATVCLSSELALEMLRQEDDQFDLLVTDQTMPGMTGIELIKEVRSFNPDMPVIVCSGFSDELNAWQGSDRQNVKVLSKPINTSELREYLLSLFSHSLHPVVDQQTL